MGKLNARAMALFACGVVASMTACAAKPTPPLPIEDDGQVELAFPPSDHRTYLIDFEFDNMVAARVVVIDPDQKKMLGMIPTGGPAPLALSHDKKTAYTADKYYSRGTRGTKVEVLTAWDTTTLSPRWEVEIPPKRAFTISERFGMNPSGDDRFLYIYNLTPATSITIVDTVQQKVVNEIAIPGCILNYPIGDRRFGSICGDGKLQVVTLDDKGQEVDRVQTPFFDPNKVRMVERAINKGNMFYFTTTQGTVHPVDFSGREPRMLDTWELATDEEKAKGWAPGGWQLTAIAPELNRLYVLMHPDHKPLNWEDPSTFIWEYDLKTGKKVRTLESPNYIWSLEATKDSKPLLLGVNIEGGLEVFDLTSGEHQGTVEKIVKTGTIALTH